MYRKQIRRRRAILLMLVVASLTLLSLYFGEGSNGPLHRISRAGATVLGPFQEGADRALKPVRDLFNWFDETFDARGENARLRDELAEARQQLAEAQTRVVQSKELGRLARFETRNLIPADMRAVTARVIGRSPTVWYSTVMIDKGSGAGLAVDDPVINGDGLVGRVSAVTSGTAQVTLITDSTSSVTARVVPVGVTGVVEPQVGEPDDLLLDFIPPGSDLAEGEIVVTAGFRGDELSSLFPPGIPIGKITDASLSEQEASQRVHLRPFADLRNMEFVQALVRAGGRAG